MTFSVRSCLTTGVAAVTAVTIAAVPSVPDRVVRPATPSTVEVRTISPPVQLTAAVQPLASAAALPDLLTDWIREIVPSASAEFPTPQFAPRVIGNSISSGIKNIYNAVEPWVQWGFEVAEYAVGWIPWVGWLAPQIMIFYNLGERIVRSITFNIADWIGGSVSFFQGLRNVAVDTINSFIYFANDELSFFLPPLPPIPPIGGGLSLATARVSPKMAGAGVTDPDTVGTTATVTDGPDAEALKREDTPAPVTDDDPGLGSAPLDEPDTAQSGLPDEVPVDSPDGELDAEVEIPTVGVDVTGDEDEVIATGDDTTQPDTVREDLGPDPKPGSEPDDTLGTELDAKAEPEAEPETKPQTKPTTKPRATAGAKTGAKTSSGSGSNR